MRSARQPGQWCFAPFDDLLRRRPPNSAERAAIWDVQESSTCQPLTAIAHPSCQCRWRAVTDYAASPFGLHNFEVWIAPWRPGGWLAGTAEGAVLRYILHFWLAFDRGRGRVRNLSARQQNALVAVLVKERRSSGNRFEHNHETINPSVATAAFVTGMATAANAKTLIFARKAAPGLRSGALHLGRRWVSSSRPSTTAWSSSFGTTKSSKAGRELGRVAGRTQYTFHHRGGVDSTPPTISLRRKVFSADDVVFVRPPEQQG
jgi:hypothetical protein